MRAMRTYLLCRCGICLFYHCVPMFATEQLKSLLLNITTTKVVTTKIIFMDLTRPTLSAPVLSPTFHVGDVPVHGDAILAPMDGFSDWPFRSLCSALGSAMSYTEFVRAEF